MTAPIHYKTLSGLLRAAERVLVASAQGQTTFDGMSRGMWLQNAQYVAENTFDDLPAFQALRKKFVVTRTQDLQSADGGHSLFGVPLPTRDYIIGDNVPGVGEITDAHGDQYLINGQWYHKRCFEKEPA